MVTRTFRLMHLRRTTTCWAASRRPAPARPRRRSKEETSTSQSLCGRSVTPCKALLCRARWTTRWVSRNCSRCQRRRLAAEILRRRCLGVTMRLGTGTMSPLPVLAPLLVKNLYRLCRTGTSSWLAYRASARTGTARSSARCPTEPSPARTCPSSLEPSRGPGPALASGTRSDTRPGATPCCKSAYLREELFLPCRARSRDHCRHSPARCHSCPRSQRCQRLCLTLAPFHCRCRRQLAAMLLGYLKASKAVLAALQHGAAPDLANPVPPQALEGVPLAMLDLEMLLFPLADLSVVAVRQAVLATPRQDLASRVPPRTLEAALPAKLDPKMLICALVDS
mmetsp:Transcript_29024/g.83176  ORF Transcript_29024/g.83176 Transcript_29024/m.83176 type:complete len:338 (+) Transcript_29024:1053-2066(+)